MRPEVQIAVNDILNGTSVDSHTEWLQREYLRLMRREAKIRSEINESKSAQSVPPIAPPATPEDVGHSGSDRTAEQHSPKDDGAGPGVDA